MPCSDGFSLFAFRENPHPSAFWLSIVTIQSTPELQWAEQIHRTYLLCQMHRVPSKRSIPWSTIWKRNWIFSNHNHSRYSLFPLINFYNRIVSSRNTASNVFRSTLFSISWVANKTLSSSLNELSWNNPFRSPKSQKYTGHIWRIRTMWCSAYGIVIQKQRICSSEMRPDIVSMSHKTSPSLILIVVKNLEKGGLMWGISSWALNLLPTGMISIKGNPCRFQTIVSIIFGDNTIFLSPCGTSSSGLSQVDSWSVER